jgi:hypothetical protein
MAITVTSPKAATFGFIKNANSADASACEEIIAAPGAGVSFHISKVTISSDSAISVTLGEGETAGAVTTALLGPVTFAAGQCIDWVFNPPLVTTANKSLTVDAGGAGNINVFVQGKTV